MESQALRLIGAITLAAIDFFDLFLGWSEKEPSTRDIVGICLIADTRTLTYKNARSYYTIERNTGISRISQ